MIEKYGVFLNGVQFLPQIMLEDVYSCKHLYICMFVYTGYIVK